MPTSLAGLPKLSADAEQILGFLAAGGALKAHRSLDGEKSYRMYPLCGEAIHVSAAAMDALKRRRLIDSNMKFPAAAYILTERGREAAASLVETSSLPLGSRGF